MTNEYRGAQARVNAMPAPTWNHLQMNEAAMQLPEEWRMEAQVEASGALLADEAPHVIEDALAQAQAAWAVAHPVPTEEELRAREEVMAAEEAATYGGTALSNYQKGADALEESRSLVRAFESGVGAEMEEWLAQAAGKHVVVQAGPGEALEAHVRVGTQPEVASVAAIDVVAGKGASVRLAIAVDSPGIPETPGAADAPGGDAAADAAGAAACLAGTSVRVFADVASRVDIARVQTLHDGGTDIDGMAVFVSDNAQVRVSQTVLGAGESYTGLACDLRGDGSRIDISTRYLGRGKQVRDFNYLVRHHGLRTQCDLQANGVLAGESSKVLRGTIDLIRGCKGAEGSENETVLLVDEGVHNKTVPVILCNEDDVAGNHGATIGHIREEQLFYLASRGLSPEEAEAMFVAAAVEQAAIEAPDEAARAGVLRLGEALVPGFSGLFEEEEHDA